MNYRKRFRVTPGRPLGHLDPSDTADVADKATAQDQLARGVARLAELQVRLYAQNSWALLIVLQGLDAAGKDSTIAHVMSGVNPQGCQVFSFGRPSDEELDHDYLWRSVRALPERGRIGIHNRSYYEEVIVTRVHPELLDRQRVPGLRPGRALWKQRFKDITHFERYLVNNGIVVLKFFLNVSKKEQASRLLERLDDPEKQWKFQPNDLLEREAWETYQEAYADMLRHTSTAWAPWYAIPADHKWFTRLAVADVICDTLEDLDLRFPKASKEQRKAWEQARTRLRNGFCGSR
jgi:PPK2 family polyphosphate:nucleotide phosphotransferase